MRILIEYAFYNETVRPLAFTSESDYLEVAIESGLDSNTSDWINLFIF
jgi:hypothetical protein